MLVVDKSKENLLIMREKELQIGSNKAKTLQEYKALATEIDSEIYNHLISKVESTKLQDLSLEEQLQVLSEIDEEYTDVFEKQCSYRNAYQTALGEIDGVEAEELVLSDLSNILIDDIRNRMSAIQGYLINVKSIQENKQALEELNLELIEESKKQDNLSSKFKEFEAELKDNFLTTEGRNYDINGNLVYNSIPTEFDNLGLDLKALLVDSELLESELNKVNEDKKASDEELLAARICYERVPTDSNHDIYESIRLENAKVNYRLALLYMANLVAKDYMEYTSIILKREQILALNDQRRNCLDALGVHISIDPFDRLRVSEQIGMITSLGDNSERIEVIKRNIGNLDSLIDDRVAQNNEYSLELKNDVELIKPKIDYTQDLADYVADVLNENNPTRVISIKDKPANMNMQIVTQKTKGVIDRVNAMLSDDAKEVEPDEVSEEVTPTLVVEPFVPEEIKIEAHEAPTEATEEIEQEPVVTTETVEAKMVDEPINLVFPDFVPEPEVKEPSQDDVFSDVVPFADISLFNDRVGADIMDDAPAKAPAGEVIQFPVEDTTTSDGGPAMQVDVNATSGLNAEANNNAMPDVFWTVNDSNQTAAPQENPSFDAQIEALIGKEDNKTKVLKKVA